MADYYVDPDASDDTGVGSIGDPFKYINTHINDLGGGDWMYLRGGAVTHEVYSESGEIDITVSGTDCYDPIRITPYQAELVEIRTSAGEAIFDIHGDHIWVLGKDQLILNKNYDNGLNAVRIDTNADWNIIMDTVIKNVQWAASIVKIEGNHTWLKGCTIYDIFNGNATDAAGVAVIDGDDNKIEDCVIYHCHGDCIIVDDAKGPDKTKILFNTLYTTQGEGSENAIDLKMNTNEWCEILDNECYGFYACTGTIGGSGDGNGEAISVHNSATKVRVIGNVIHDCTCGINVDDNRPDIIIMRNEIYDLHDTTEDPNALAASMAAIGIDGSSITVAHNTIYDCPEKSMWWHAHCGATVVIRNNIFSECGTIEDNALTPTATHNCWYNCSETYSTDAGATDVTSDPKLTDPANGDMTLESDSPCIDVGSTTDNDYYFGSDPDMGAREYSDGAEVVKVLLWRSNGTGDGDVGDLMCKVWMDEYTPASETIVDYSAI